MTGFEGFTDSVDAAFYRSGAMTPEATWADAAARLARVLDDVVTNPRQRPITTSRVCGWHRAVFLTTFPADAGRLRGDGEASAFTVTASEQAPLLLHGVLGLADLRSRLDGACAAFNRAAERLIAERDLDVEQAAAAASELYLSVLEVHPFVDGNLRAAFIAFTAALRIFGLPLVRFGKALGRHDAAVAAGLRVDAQRQRGAFGELVLELLSAELPFS
jgi:fido (protein-threonine AMPylation protein)